jgi:hypothetical protein
MSLSKMVYNKHTFLKGVFMKKCKRCNVEKPFKDFYVHKAMADGYLNFCKECTKSRVSKRREINIEYVRQYDKQRAMLPKRVQARKEYAKTDAGKVAKNKAIKSYREKHTDRYYAHTAVANALKDGKLKKHPCLICGEVEVEGHHPDYSRPLDVVWMCKTHHLETHKLTKELI